MAYELPMPAHVLHTHVQAEHCGEWSAFPNASVLVPTGQVDLATVSARFRQDCVTVWGPEREWESRGVERYGIAGCVTARPPGRPLNVTGTLTPGETFQWRDVELYVLALPGSDARAVGLYWADAGVLFSGDLLHAGGWCVNLHDIERSYGMPTGYTELRDSLETVRQLAPTIMCPTTGPVIVDPVCDASRCLDRTAWVASPTIVRRTDRTYALTNYAPIRETGNYREVLPGLWQQTNSGNIILYVDTNGIGVMIDPGPCYYPSSWDTTCDAMNADLDMLEREAGLRRVAAVLLTHFHGDHLECCDLVRDRYGAKVLAPPDVADVVERPEDFLYPCRIPWYGYPFDRVRLDGQLDYGETVRFGEIVVTPFPLQGHCAAEAGYAAAWDGEMTVCTGDAVQYGDGPIATALPILCNSPGSLAAGIRAIAAWKPTVLLGGHSHSCFDADGSILRDLAEAAQETDALVAGMVPPQQ